MNIKKTISIPDDLSEQIEIIAEMSDRSYSNYIVHAVRSEIKKQMSKYPEIRERFKSGVGNSESAEYLHKDER